MGMGVDVGTRSWRRGDNRAGRLRWVLPILLLCVACSGGSVPTEPKPTAAPQRTPTAPAPFPTATVAPATPVASVTSAPVAEGGGSEGVHATGADVWHAAGITGKGVKVGVIDGGFIDYARLLAGAKVTARSFRQDELIADPTADEDTVHGAACAEIVHEMAPDAELFLAATDTTGNFLAAVQWLVNAAGVSVITTSLGFYGDYPTDGSSELAQAVDTAKAAGVFFV